jgi:hypothetical protein
MAKRVHYFTHMFLREQDFNDEQAYHLEARRRHNRLLHTWGVVEGLEVHQHGEFEIVIDPGMAIDKEGREIVVAQSIKRNLSSFSHDTEAYITLQYLEEMEEEDHLATAGVEGYVRVTEMAEVHERRQEHLDEGALVLARVHVGNHGQISQIDMSPAVRKLARQESSFPQGWLRIPFKPSRINTVSINPSEQEFMVDEVHAYCGENGARGSMQIPVPPGASRISAFRLAGSTRGELQVRLFRTGWNLADGKGENTRLLEEKLFNGSFHREIEISAAIEESHTLAVAVRAIGVSEVWLLAVKFH